MTASQLGFVASAHVSAAAGGARVLAGGDGDFGAGFIAFMVVVVLGIACYFLFKSMSRHLRNVPSSFDAPGSQPPAPTDPEQG